MQGPHNVAQLQKWMRFLTDSPEEEHKLAYEQFQGVAVYKVRARGGCPPACLSGPQLLHFSQDLGVLD